MRHNILYELMYEYGIELSKAVDLVNKYPKIVERAKKRGSSPSYPAKQILAREKDGLGDDPDLSTIAKGDAPNYQIWKPRGE